MLTKLRAIYHILRGRPVAYRFRFRGPHYHAWWEKPHLAECEALHWLTGEKPAKKRRKLEQTQDIRETLKLYKHEVDMNRTEYDKTGLDRYDLIEDAATEAIEALLSKRELEAVDKVLSLDLDWKINDMTIHYLPESVKARLTSQLTNR